MATFVENQDVRLIPVFGVLDSDPGTLKLRPQKPEVSAAVAMDPSPAEPHPAEWNKAQEAPRKARSGVDESG